jgi:hypothetical protein
MLLNTYRNSRSGNGHQQFDQYQNYRQHAIHKGQKRLRLKLFSQEEKNCQSLAVNVDSRSTNLAVMASPNNDFSFCSNHGTVNDSSTATVGRTYPSITVSLPIPHLCPLTPGYRWVSPRLSPALQGVLGIGNVGFKHFVNHYQMTCQSYADRLVNNNICDSLNS